MAPSIVKAHAFGNDFLLLNEADVPPGVDRAAFARRVCDRHRGIGGDGLILFAPGYPGTRIRMSLLNADGSYSEVSGNGVRCLAAWVASERRLTPGSTVDVQTDAGLKRLELLEQSGGRYTFRADMGTPEAIARAKIDVAGQVVDAITLCVGNPQCVVLGEVTVERLHAVAARLAVHPHFPAGTNVELASVETPERVRILIWERGVGPTEASGTGACAAAVAAISFGGAHRDVRVESPGGTQRVEWREEGLFLTGWAELTSVCDWRGEGPADA
ncbi:MAG: diaminopimelate epimerase [Acidobacteria bacterium]|nr:diaminopimelate epimerase [Acidobacteriota bacterium]